MDYGNRARDLDLRSGLVLGNRRSKIRTTLLMDTLRNSFL